LPVSRKMIPLGWFVGKSDVLVVCSRKPRIMKCHICNHRGHWFAKEQIYCIDGYMCVAANVLMDDNILSDLQKYFINSNEAFC
jgi:hypothetical protein